MLKWILVLTLLISTFCFADTEDYVHADFYRGLAGLKQQVEEINRDLLLLENATLSYVQNDTLLMNFVCSPLMTECVQH